MIVNFKGFIQDFDIGINKFTAILRQTFQSISEKFSDWGSLRRPQSKTSD